MFCPNCGTQNADGAKFCSGCGDKNTVKIAGVKTARDATSPDLRRAELSQKDLETLAPLQNLTKLVQAAIPGLVVDYPGQWGV